MHSEAAGAMRRVRGALVSDTMRGEEERRATRLGDEQDCLERLTVKRHVTSGAGGATGTAVGLRERLELFECDEVLRHVRVQHHVDHHLPKLHYCGAEKKGERKRGKGAEGDGGEGGRRERGCEAAERRSEREG